LMKVLGMLIFLGLNVFWGENVASSNLLFV
jgi:hypothetical protein